jgi:deoxyribonuclease V
MIAAFDVHYLRDDASAPAVLFSDYGDAAPSAEYALFLSGAADYVPGEFYKRELPSCILIPVHRSVKPAVLFFAVLREKSF